MIKFNSVIYLIVFLFLNFSIQLSADPSAPPSASAGASEGELLELNVSGQPGSNAPSGYSFGSRAGSAASGSNMFTNSMIQGALGTAGDFMGLMGGGGGDGRNGRNGGSAGPAVVGQDAGAIQVYVHGQDPNAQLSGVMIVDAGITAPGSTSTNSKNYTLQYGDHGYLYLYSVGGNGGHGGDGGDGEAGRAGEPGRNASRHIPGGSGGDGGNGGNGGNATSGAPGGKGGAISIRVPEKDAALLLLVKPSIDGGVGGDPGVNGEGGQGGPGGPGGASAMGSDTKYRTVSDGHGGTTTESYEEPWFMPGGMDGSRGHTGSNGQATVNKGDHGQAGSLQYILEKSDGTVLKATQGFNLTLTDFNFADMDGNGIFEPGEIVTVNHIAVRNDGQLPTPPNQKTEVFIANRDWVLTDGFEAEIPRSLQPGESYVLPEIFKFKIKDTRIDTVGPRFVTQDSVEPLAHILEVNRLHENFDNPKKFEITFPVEITPITGLRSLAPGEQSKVSFKITNISTKDLGSLSELKRQIIFTLRGMGGNMDPANITLRDSSGKPVNLADSGTAQGIDILKAGESFVLEGTVQLSANTQTLTQYTIRSTLELQHPLPERAKEIYPVQNEEYKVSAAQTFRMSPNPGILLITNSDSTKDEIEAWLGLGQTLNLPVDIWDASYYGKLPLLENQKDGKSLAQMYENKTIVILDNDWKTSVAENKRTLRSSDLLKKNEFLKTAAVHGINTLVVGSENSTESILNRFYFPNEGQSRAVQDVSQFLRGIRHGLSPDLALSEINEYFSEIEFGDWQFFGKPKTDKLVKATDKLSQVLSRIAPDEQYVVAYNIDPKMTKKYLWGFFNKFHLGTIQIRRTLSRDIGLVASVSGRDNVVHDPTFVTSEENLFAFFVALPAERRAQIIAQALTNPEYAEKLTKDGILDVLLKSTLSDIAVEQSKASRRTIARHVDILNLIAKYAARAGSLPEENQKILAHFVAQLHYFSSSQVRWWMYFVPLSTQRNISDYIKEKTNQIWRAATGDKESRTKVAALVKQEYKALKAKDKDLKASDRPAEVFKRYTSEETNGKFLYWGQVENLAHGKVYTVSDFEKHDANDKKDLQAQVDTENLLRGERCQLLLVDPKL